MKTFCKLPRTILTLLVAKGSIDVGPLVDGKGIGIGCRESLPGVGNKPIARALLQSQSVGIVAVQKMANFQTVIGGILIGIVLDCPPRLKSLFTQLIAPEKLKYSE